MSYARTAVYVLLLIAPVLVALYHQWQSTDHSSSSDATITNLHLHSKSITLTTSICLLSNDVYGLPGAGGTATALYALAKLLVQHDATAVHYIAARYSVTPEQCTTLTQQYHNDGITLHCLTTEDVTQASVSETTPDDTSAYALIVWWQRVGHKLNCSHLHTHEWGGVAASLLTWLPLFYRQQQQSQHAAALTQPITIAQAHGGYTWSVHHDDLMFNSATAIQLRIDAAERTTIEHSDYLVSPSYHMLSFLRARGWALPAAGMVPNVLLPVAAPSTDTPPFKERSVDTLLFLGRLEQRKGLLVFVEAVNRLADVWTFNTSIKFVGISTMIRVNGQQVSSSEWVHTQAQQHWSSWGQHASIISDLTQAQVQQLIRGPGVLLVLPSLMDNAPYTVVEALQQRVPMITADVGDVRLMVSVASRDNCTVLPAGDVDILAQCLHRILRHGKHWVSQLSDKYDQPQQWIDFHQQTLLHRHRLQTTPRSVTVNVEVLSLDYGAEAVTFSQLYHRICSAVEASPWTSRSQDDRSNVTAIVLMPPGFQLLHNPSVTTAYLQDILTIASHRSATRQVGAYVFGVRWHDNLTNAYPTAPTWAAYGPDDGICDHSPPVVILQHVFCVVATPNTAIFTRFSLPQLEEMYRRQSIQVQAFPAVLFRRSAPTGIEQVRADCSIRAVEHIKFTDMQRRTAYSSPAEYLLHRSAVVG